MFAFVLVTLQMYVTFLRNPNFCVNLLRKVFKVKPEDVKRRTNHTPTFFALIEELATHGLSISDAAQAIDKAYTTVYSWKQRGSGAKLPDVHKLVEMFPVQLTMKARELGIEVPSLAKKMESVTLAELSAKSKEELLLTVVKLQQEIAEIKKKGHDPEVADQLNAKAERLKDKLRD